MERWPVAAAVAAAVGACSGEIVLPPGLEVGGEPGPTGPGSAGTSATGGCSAGGTGAATDAGWPDFGIVADVPTYPPDLLAYLRAGEYWSFEARSDVVATSRHGITRYFFNSILVDSLESGNAAHPEGSVAIREIFWSAADLQPLGWSAAIKVQPDSAAGQGWYWYSINTMAGTEPAYAQTGASYCLSCHHSADHDYVYAVVPMAGLAMDGGLPDGGAAGGGSVDVGTSGGGAPDEAAAGAGP